VEQEFARMIVPVLVIGTVIAAIGVTILILAFRAFGTADAGKTRHLKLLAALIVFVLVCCIGLFIVSFR
jgi:xanthine/uracil permease